MNGPTILWFRRDFRISDNPALIEALKHGGPIIPLFVMEENDPWGFGGAARWWLKRSIEALQSDLKCPLWIRKGDARQIIPDLVRKHEVSRVFWNRRYDPFGIQTDTEIKVALKDQAVEVSSFNGRLGREPFEVKTQSGGPFKVFTPYAKAWLSLPDLTDPLPSPGAIHCLSDTAPVSLDDLGLEPDWPHRFDEFFTPGEAYAHARLEDFMADHAPAYKINRDLPALDGTSRMSPHLAFGEITPRQIIACALRHHGGLEPVLPFIRQVIWRDFAYHNLFNAPHLPDRSLRSEFEDYPWIEDEDALRSWQLGQTGFPIVDAGMRELWATGYMHNRVRMIAGSFLTKDLRIHWRQGAAWFWDTLLDADLANNSMGWQWVAGSGIDAAPYFRIFNPTTQSEKFDAKGDYIRAWVPELARLDNRDIHKPEDAGFSRPSAYPPPMVDHKSARNAALEGYQLIRKSA